MSLGRYVQFDIGDTVFVKVAGSHPPYRGTIVVTDFGNGNHEFAGWGTDTVTGREVHFWDGDVERVVKKS